MNPTDAEIDKMRGEISRLCSNIWSNGFDAEGPDDKDFCHEFAEIDVILEGLYGRAVVERIDGERFTIPEIATGACEHNPDQINDPQDGLAATTERNRKEQG